MKAKDDALKRKATTVTSDKARQTPRYEIVRDNAPERPESWPRRVLIQSENCDEFQQSLEVARLAVQLSSLRRDANAKKNAAQEINLRHEKSRLAGNPAEQEKIDKKIMDLAVEVNGKQDPKGFLREAWNLIAAARLKVTRPITNAENVAAKNGDHEAIVEAVGLYDKDRRIPFGHLCNSEPPRKNITFQTKNPKSGDTGPDVVWQVYTTEKGFNKLFWSWWNAKKLPDEIKTAAERKDAGEWWLEDARERGIVENEVLELHQLRKRRCSQRTGNLKQRNCRRSQRTGNLK